MDGLTGSVDEARAHRLSPTDLMNGQGPSIEQGKMRRIIHQSWKTTELPKRFAEWQKTWQRRHPAWSYVLWCVSPVSSEPEHMRGNA